MRGKEGKILIVDDDEYIGLSLKLLLDEHFECVTSVTDAQLIPELLKESYDVLILDMNFKKGDTDGHEGMSWLRRIHQDDPALSILLLTAYGDISLAVDAMKEGAIDFIVKPWNNHELLATVRSARQLTNKRNNLPDQSDRQQGQTFQRINTPQTMLGGSEAIEEVFRMIRKVAPTEADILLLGENGTGKEVAARKIHEESSRKNAIFEVVDVGSIPESLFESELFGHKKGSFTDAIKDHKGRFQAANGGTLFLDEIGNLTLALQAKLLRVLQRRQVIPVGDHHPVDLDVRIICATNSNLHEMVCQHAFREDLLYRINTVEIFIPPLRDRLEDINLLAPVIVKNYAGKYGKDQLTLAQNGLDYLRSYAWPGNIRELKHVLERAVIMSEDEELTREDFRFIHHKQLDYPAMNNFHLESLEEWAIRQAIRKHQGNISHAAKELGISRGAMYRRMEKYHLGEQP